MAQFFVLFSFSNHQIELNFFFHFPHHPDELYDQLPSDVFKYCHLRAVKDSREKKFKGNQASLNTNGQSRVWLIIIIIINYCLCVCEKIWLPWSIIIHLGKVKKNKKFTLSLSYFIDNRWMFFFLGTIFFFILGTNYLIFFCLFFFHPFQTSLIVCYQWKNGVKKNISVVILTGCELTHNDTTTQYRHEWI